MPITSNADQVAAHFYKAGQGMGRANRVGVERACLAGKQVMLASMAAAGVTGRLRGVGKNGARVGVNYRVYGTTNPVGVLRYIGPVHLVESGTVPHDITPKRKKALAPAGNPWAAASADHPGTKGKKFAERAEPVVVGQSRQIIVRETRNHLARSFAG